AAAVRQGGDLPLNRQDESAARGPGRRENAWNRLGDLCRGDGRAIRRARCAREAPHVSRYALPVLAGPRGRKPAECGYDRRGAPPARRVLNKNQKIEYTRPAFTTN